MKPSSGWNNNGNGTNSSGFNALPGGYRYTNGTFYGVGGNGYWWSATEYSATSAWSRNMYYDLSDVGRFDGGKELGFSVRCVRD